jgi:hypothetical protein
LINTTSIVSFRKQRAKSDETDSIKAPGNAFVDHEYQLIQFNGSLGHESPYSGQPSDKIDAAWNALTHGMFRNMFVPTTKLISALVGIMSLTEEEVLKSGQSLDSVRFPPEIGSGQYIGSVEVNHQLHCLNFLRKATYQDYYASKAIEWTDDPVTFRHHLDHCIEMIRQNVMCHADTGIITHNWVKHFPRPYPNFNTWHKCRNFDSVMEWVKDSQLPQRPPNGADEWPKVPGSVVLDTPP